jgi:hypothetical protein
LPYTQTEKARRGRMGMVKGLAFCSRLGWGFPCFLS